MNLLRLIDCQTHVEPSLCMTAVPMPFRNPSRLVIKASFAPRFNTSIAVRTFGIMPSLMTPDVMRSSACVAREAFQQFAGFQHAANARQKNNAIRAHCCANRACDVIRIDVVGAVITQANRRDDRRHNVLSEQGLIRISARTDNCFANPPQVAAWMLQSCCACTNPRSNPEMPWASMPASCSVVTIRALTDPHST